MRLELRATDDSSLKNRTVIYWEIRPAKNAGAVKQIKEDLSKLGYDKPLDDPALAAEDNFIVGDDSDYLFGGSPNVRFPPHFRKERRLFCSCQPGCRAVARAGVGAAFAGRLGAAARLAPVGSYSKKALRDDTRLASFGSAGMLP